MLLNTKITFFPNINPYDNLLIKNSQRYKNAVCSNR